MKIWPYENVRRVTLSRWLFRGSRQSRGGVSSDSRHISPGDLFIAIKGPNFDGHQFLPQVIAAGAAGLLVDQPLTADVRVLVERESVSVLQTDNTIRGLNRLATAYRRDVRAKIIAVGGANGKTTTKQIMHTLLSARFSGIASPRSFNNNIGLPLTLLSIEPQHEYAVLEIGTNAPGEVAALAQVALPDIAVITGVGLEHLEFLKDLPTVAREEASLARFVAPTGMLMLTNQSPELLHALRFSRIARITVGAADTGAEFAASEISENWRGCSFLLNGRQRYDIPLLGRHNVFNAILAMAVARRLGLTDDEITTGLARVKPASMRLEIQRRGTHHIVNDAYNANPTSMAGALETLARLPFPEPWPSGRRIAILGDMLELGPTSPELHRDLGRLVVGHRLDLLVAVGPLMRLAHEQVLSAGRASHYFPDSSSAAAALPGLLNPADVILLKGSRGMRMELALRDLPECLPLKPEMFSAPLAP